MQKLKQSIMVFEEVRGKKGKDLITGLEGTITAIAYYIDDYISVKLESKSSEGKLHEEWFSHKRIEIIE